MAGKSSAKRTFKRKPKAAVSPDMNVTPLVDVVLVLLIIFMVLTPLVLREIGVTIPRKADEEVTADVAAQQVVLHLKADGSLLLDGQPVSMADLSRQVRLTFERRRERVLFIRVDDAAGYGRAVEVMDRCRAAGVTTLGMTTKR